MLALPVLILLELAAASQNAPITLPKGVKSVTFGTAHRYYGPGKEMCVIVYPMPGGVVKSASARVIAPAAQELRAVGCHVFMPVKGGFTQTQIGNTLSRADKQPLRSGQYMLRVTVDGQTVDVSFTIK
jgi:hypothetical protein